MLAQIEIKDLAIIDYLRIDFDQGFNIITGETGAGKSILIKALNLLVGGKAQLDSIRSGADQLSVAGVFYFPLHHPIISQLEKLSIPLEHSSDDLVQLIVRRSYSQRSKSSAWVNDVVVTFNTLRLIGSHLLDIMSQFENHKLLDPATHIQFLDQFLEKKSSSYEYLKTYQNIYAELDSLKKFHLDLEQSMKNQDYLEFRLSELQDFSPSQKDYDELKNLCDKSKKSEVLLEQLHGIQSILDESYQGKPLNKALSDISRRVLNMSPNNENMIANLDQAKKLIDDFSFEIGKLVNSFDLDEGVIHQSKERLSSYYDLFRKHHLNDAEGLEKLLTSLQVELKSISSARTFTQDKLQMIAVDIQKIQTLASELTEGRKKSAKYLTKKINQELKELAMPSAELFVQLTPLEKSDFSVSEMIRNNPLWPQIERVLLGLNASGQEKVQFLMRTNAGESFHPLQKIASGGEVSRIMLALKKILVSEGETCILIFDEIDTGISGRVADVVGKKLKELSARMQVICISHLPQVAAYANNHYQVVKEQFKLSGKNIRTKTTIRQLTANESIEELARLLSGTEVTKSSYQHAKTLKEAARSHEIQNSQ